MALRGWIMTLVLLVCGLTVLVGFPVAAHNNGGNVPAATLIGVLFGGGLAAFAVYMIRWALLEAKKEKVFEDAAQLFPNYFEFEFPGKENVRFFQAYVDSKLRELAAAYGKAATDQNRLMSQLSQGGFIAGSTDPRSAKLNLDQAKERLAAQKSVFWDTLGVARDAGFEVREKYTDYCLKDERFC